MMQAASVMDAAIALVLSLTNESSIAVEKIAYHT
jgi:hypothetical protein